MAVSRGANQGSVSAQKPLDRRCFCPIANEISLGAECDKLASSTQEIGAVTAIIFVAELLELRLAEKKQIAVVVDVASVNLIG